MTYSVYDLLRSLVEHGASDLHVKAGAPPGFRKDGQIQPQQEFGVLDGNMAALFRQSLPQLQKTEDRKSIMFCA